MTAVKAALSSANSNGIGVIVELCNFGHYVNATAWGHTIFAAGNGWNQPPASNVYVLGDSNLPVADLTDFWTRMATELHGTAGLAGYGLMNEPVNMVNPAPPNASTWQTAAQASVTAIRNIDTSTPIYVMGNYSASGQFPTLTGTNLKYEVHFYPTDLTDPYSGVRTALPALTWAQLNNQTLYVGEFGYQITGPNDPNLQP